jgi:DMSO/TMAO reductase YedYZ molybdopterin-dependent catalytic subunit
LATRRGQLLGALLALTWAGLGPSLAADQERGQGAADSAAKQASLVVEGPAGKSIVAMPKDFAGLARATVSLATEHGAHQARFEGPLLWSVLDRMGAVDANKPREQVRQTVLVTGSDGYTAVLALGEISPDFAGKPVILADRMDGQPLAPEHLRLVVPDERRGGRSVRDVVKISVGSPQPAAR